MTDQRFARCARAGFALMLLTPPLAAQSADSLAVAAPGFCWRARALPRCASFPITEVALTQSLATTRTNPDPQYSYGDYSDFRAQLVWTVGFMSNKAPRRAQGITVSLRAESGGDVSPAVEWRNRLWNANARSYVDLSAGYTNKEVFLRPPGVAQRINSVNAHGATASAIIAPIDLIGLVARGDVVFTSGRAHYGFSAGAQTGSYGSAIATGAVAAFVVLVLVALAGADF
jgi:hypothetical protein